MQFIHNLSCINKEGKCDNCPLCDQCQYYHLTGENFKQYPGICISNTLFPKAIYRDNEDLVINLYLIGNCDNYSAYIELFFQDYLNHHFVGFDFQIKALERETINCSTDRIKGLHFSSLVEEGNIKDVYNTMMHYYNLHYDTAFDLLQNMYQEKGMPTSYKPISLGTKRIVPRGLLYKNIHADEPWNTLVFYIGLGKFNYIGGGKIET